MSWYVAYSSLICRFDKLCKFLFPSIPCDFRNSYGSASWNLFVGLLTVHLIQSRKQSRAPLKRNLFLRAVVQYHFEALSQSGFSIVSQWTRNILPFVLSRKLNGLQYIFNPVVKHNSGESVQNGVILS